MQTRAKIIIFTLLLIGILSALALVPPIISANARATNAIPLITPTPSAPAIPSGPPLSLTISLLCFCLTMSLIVGVFVLGVVVRRKGSADDKL
ncbi:MAG: hypothetical protein AABZ00_19185 [Chloroflexota bacterium]